MSSGFPAIGAQRPTAGADSRAGIDYAGSMDQPIVTNLLAPLPHSSADEVFERLLERDGFTLERIVSFGHTTAPETWYDQDRDEWVLLLAGGARLRFEESDPVDLGPGDALLIPARCRHRVEWTQPGCETVWLALHAGAAQSAPQER